MRGTKSALLLLLITGGLSACAPMLAQAPQTSQPTHQVDRTAWERDLASIGVTHKDLAEAERNTRRICEGGPPFLRAFVAIARNDGTDLTPLRVDFRHVCPDQLDELRKAEDQMKNPVGSLTAACQQPAAARTKEQKDLISIVGGCRET